MRALLLLYPLIEIAALALSVHLLGFGWTLLLVVAGTVAGLLLVRNQWRRVIDGLRRMSERIIAEWRNAARSAPTLRDEQHAQVAAIDALVSLWKRDVEGADFLRAKLAKAAKR